MKSKIALLVTIIVFFTVNPSFATQSKKPVIAQITLSDITKIKDFNSRYYTDLNFGGPDYVYLLYCEKAINRARDLYSKNPGSWSQDKQAAKIVDAFAQVQVHIDSDYLGCPDLSDLIDFREGGLIMADNLEYSKPPISNLDIDLKKINSKLVSNFCSLNKNYLKDIVGRLKQSDQSLTYLMGYSDYSNKVLKYIYKDLNNIMANKTRSINTKDTDIFLELLSTPIINPDLINSSNYQVQQTNQYYYFSSKPAYLDLYNGNLANTFDSKAEKGQPVTSVEALRSLISTFNKTLDGCK